MGYFVLPVMKKCKLVQLIWKMYMFTNLLLPSLNIEIGKWCVQTKLIPIWNKPTIKGLVNKSCVFPLSSCFR